MLAAPICVRQMFTRFRSKHVLARLAVMVVSLSLTISMDAQIAYLLGEGQFMAVDTQTNTLTYTVPAPCGNGPYCSGYYQQNLAISPDGTTIYLSGFVNPNTGNPQYGLFTFNTQTLTFSNPISLGGAQPTGEVHLSPDGHSLYVETLAAGGNQAAAMVVFNTASNSVVTTIQFPFAALRLNEYVGYGTAMAPDTSRLYVISDADPTQIAVIDTTTGSVMSTLSLQYTYTDSRGVAHNTHWSAARIGFSTDGSIAYLEGQGNYAAAGGSPAGTDPGTILLAINTASNRVIGEVQDPYSGQQVSLHDFKGPIVCGDNGYCYVSDSFGSDPPVVHVISATSLAVTANVPNPVQSGPTAGALTPDGHSLYWVNWQGGPWKMDTVTNDTFAINIANSFYFTGIAIASAGNFSSISPKSLGCSCAAPHPEPNPVGQSTVGHPISVGTGNMFEQATDYTSAGANPLAVIRYYNSMGNATGVRTTLASALGVNWRSNFDRFLQIGSSKITAERANGQQLIFTLNNGLWTSDSDVDLRLTQSGSTWTLSDHDDTTETYTVSGSIGLLQTITARNGYTQTLTYSGSLLSTVKDSYSRTLAFAYASTGLLQSVTTPDNTTLTYGFTAAGGGSELTSVSFPTTPVATITYQYRNASFPFAMTAIIDENGQTFTSWTYDAAGSGYNL